MEKNGRQKIWRPLQQVNTILCKVLLPYNKLCIFSDANAPVFLTV